MSDDWVAFPGGELEGERTGTLCPSCREQLSRTAPAGARRRRPGTLCFQCYRTEFDRQKALRAAGQLDTASEERFQCALPFEPVNRPRLAMLKAERAGTRAGSQSDGGRFTERRRQAQIAARHALRSLAGGMRLRKLGPSERERVLSAAIRAAELQLPESWLPFVVSR